MRERNLVSGKEVNLEPILRRSPRFQQTLRRSPRFQSETRGIAVTVTKPSPRKTRNSSLTGSSRVKIQEISGKSLLSGKKEKASLKRSNGSSEGLRVSAGVNGGADLVKNEMAVDARNRYVIEKRVTRSSYRRSEVLVTGNVSEEDPKGMKSTVDSSLDGQFPDITEKRVSRSSSQKKLKGIANNSSTQNEDEVVILKVAKRGTRCGHNDPKRMTQVGGRRKRDRVEEDSENVRGWTKAEELALQRAYFSAKPTPSFWKKVARMVPGKSAQECLDRIHSDHLTPQPQTRSRTNRNKTSPSSSFSASNLLSHLETKTKRLKLSQRNRLLSRKTVRQLLQKQHNKDQDYEADLFAVLEPTSDLQSLNFGDSSAFCSPASNTSSSNLTRCGQRTSSLVHKKHFSRVNISGSSPPVLKRIKDKVLHERYLDQLCSRDAKRNADAARNGKHTKDIVSNKNTCHLKENSVKIARNALICEAEDAINRFNSTQSNMGYENLNANSIDGCADDSEVEL